MVEFLLKSCGKEEQRITESARIPLLVACRLERLPIVKFLIEARDPNDGYPEFCATPLVVAAKGGMLEIVQYLLDSRSRVNQANTSDGESPLYVASGWDAQKLSNC